MTLRGSCETETKTKDGQKYVVHKNGDVAELTFTIGLSALLGVTDVRKEALDFVTAANKGERAYFYYGSKKLIPAKLMLTSAEISDIEPLAKKPDKWISCSVKVTFKQAGAKGGAASSGTSKKKSTKAAGTSGSQADGSGFFSKVTNRVNDVLKKCNKIIEDAKKASKDKVQQADGRFEYYVGVSQKTQQSANSAAKVHATTGRATSVGAAVSIVKKVRATR